MVVLALALAGCAQTDLGAPCHLLAADNTEQSPRPGLVIVQSGSGECEQFTCLSSNGQAPVCSRPCEQAGDGCENGFTCRAAILEPATLELVRQRLEGTDADGNGVDDYQELVGASNGSLYCVPD